MQNPPVADSRIKEITAGNEASLDIDTNERMFVPQNQGGDGGAGGHK